MELAVTLIATNIKQCTKTCDFHYKVLPSTQSILLSNKVLPFFLSPPSVKGQNVSRREIFSSAQPHCHFSFGSSIFLSNLGNQNQTSLCSSTLREGLEKCLTGKRKNNIKKKKMSSTHPWKPRVLLNWRLREGHEGSLPSHPLQKVQVVFFMKFNI